MLIEHIDVRRAADLAKGGATLVDVRESHEFAAERIPGSINAPLSRIAHGPLPSQAKKPLIFFCLSGARTRFNARVLDQVGGQDSYIMDGGIAAWKASGQPTTRG